VGLIANNQQKNSMASFNFDFPAISAGTMFIFSFWICMANNQGGFNKHLVNPKGSGGINGDLQP
jgi:hypothetical protein